MENGGPFRVPRPADRKVANRPDQASRQQVETQSVSEEPKATSRAASPKHTPQPSRSLKRIILPLLLIVIIVAAGVFAWSKMQNTGTAIDSSKYQAVFFTNGQVYFGKLTSFNGEYMQLTDIYYLQSQQSNTTEDGSENPQQTSTDKNGVQLIKLGDEIHGPEDKMVISKDQVLFYENLKSDGKVAQSIDKFKAPK